MEQIKCYCGHTTYCDCGPLEVSDEAKQRAANYMSLKGALEPKEPFNLDEMESKLDEALSKETNESLTDWLEEKREQEEPKQPICEHIKEYGCIKDICTCNTGPKQESTLEEAAKSKAFEFSVDYKPWETSLDYREYAEYGFEKGFITGAKWQQERMVEMMDSYADDVMGGCTLRAKEWFEQYKKK